MADNVSTPHVLIVGEYVPEEPGDCFEVEHPEDCPTETHDAGDFGSYISYISYTCLVGHFLAADGVEMWFRHQDEPVDDQDSREALAPGRHVIEAWSAYDPPHPGGGGEWDGGLCTVEVPF